MGRERRGAQRRDELEGDGYEVEVRFAGDDIPAQLRQLRVALESGPAAVVIAPVDATAVAAELAAADDPDVAIISYDRLVLDAPEVDYYATFDHREAGRMQAQALLDGLGLADPASHAGSELAVELLAGSGDDPATQDSFAGSIEVLQPYLDAGAIVVPSGRTDLEQAAILRGEPSTAASRVAGLLEDRSGARRSAVAIGCDERGRRRGACRGGHRGGDRSRRLDRRTGAAHGDRAATPGRDDPAEHRRRAGCGDGCGVR